MPNIIPPNKPRISYSRLMTILEPFNYPIEPDKMFLVGVRGYYKESLGATPLNERGIYDDAMLLVSPYVFATFNANTDPSIARPNIATLKPGFYQVHKFDMHRPAGGFHHEAICQRAGTVTVIRDGNPPITDSGRFGINIHKGRVNTTSSEGCQTIYPTQWVAFYNLAKEQAIRTNPEVNFRDIIITYILIENNGEI
jgi:hypothetical protein